jgi:hypothetical protein
VKKYYPKIEGYDDIESDDYEVPILKLGSNKSSRSITRPRNYLNLGDKGIRVVPVFALKSYVDALEGRAKDEVVRVTFIKDNGTERIIDTTLNSNLLVDLYKDSGFVSGMLESSYNGDFLGSKVIDRGYIRVPEVGASIYDGSGVRAISYSRVGGVAFGVEPDMEFARVDLERVVYEFGRYVGRLEEREVSSVVRALVIDGFDLSTLVDSEGNHKFLIDSYQLETWADLQNRVLSTSFQRALCLFMLGNPQWFSGFTGEREGLSSLYVSESSSGLADLDDFI